MVALAFGLLVAGICGAFLLGLSVGREDRERVFQQGVQEGYRRIDADGGMGPERYQKARQKIEEKRNHASALP